MRTTEPANGNARPPRGTFTSDFADGFRRGVERHRAPGGVPPKPLIAVLIGLLWAIVVAGMAAVVSLLAWLAAWPWM